MVTKERKKMTITNRIAEALKQEINYGKLNSGEAIIERKIAERFHASNIPVREALRILEGEGFIIHKKFSGYSVRQINPEEMIELYDIIKYLSGQLLSKGIPRYTELTYHQFRTLIDEMEKSKEIDKLVSLLVEFAEVAYTPAGLKFSLELAMQILHRNIPIIKGMVEKIYKGKIPTQFQRHYMDLCQQKKTNEAIELWIGEYERMTKDFVAIISVFKPNNP